MQKITQQTGRALKWVQPSAFKMAYELRSGEEIIAALRFRSAFGTLATAESADGCWTFKRVGFFQTRVTIRSCSTDEQLAVFRNNTWSGGGTLTFSDGREFLATTNFWHTSLEFRQENGKPLVRLNSRGMLLLSADVEVQPEAASLSELPLLVLFGWYLIVMMYQDSTVATTAASAAIS